MVPAAAPALSIRVPALPFTNGLTRTDHEIEAELFRLYSLELRAPSRTEYGEPVSDAIRAQIAVLRGRLTSIQTFRRFEDEDTISDALNVCDWLYGDGDLPSDGWASIGIE